MSNATTKILIVDDDPMFAMVMALEMKRAGYTAAVAHSGREALEYLKKNSVDAIVSDICMPEMTGLDLLKKIKNDSPGVPMPMPMLMLMTGSSDVSSAEARANGAEALFSKTLNRAILVDTVKNFISHRKICNAESKTKIKITFSSFSEALDVSLLTVHDKGLYVGLGENFPQVYDDCEFKIFLDKTDQVEGTGVVSWVRTQSTVAWPKGCGIEFIHVSKDSLQFLNELAKHI